MLIPTIVMGVLAIILFFVAVHQGGGAHVEGLKITKDLLIQVVPLLLLAFIVAGMVQVLLPHETIAKWVGTESGLRGIMIGTLAGSITPGGPYVTLPIAAGIWQAGAGIGTMVAFVTSWSLWAVMRLPMEIGIMGWEFTLVRIACTFFFPPIAGLLANRLFSWVT
ncbi:MAG: permease [Chloroflexota bacterium]|nr:permease [Chloroflexota bacterium]